MSDYIVKYTLMTQNNMNESHPYHSQREFNN